MINKVPLSLFELLQHTLHVVVRLALSENLVDAVVTVLNELAVIFVH